MSCSPFEGTLGATKMIGRIKSVIYLKRNTYTHDGTELRTEVARIFILQATQRLKQKSTKLDLMKSNT